MKVRIESKKDMISRTSGKSPDKADSFLIGLELCRERLNFRAVGMENTRAELPKQKQQRKLLLNRIYANADYRTDYANAA